MKKTWKVISKQKRVISKQDIKGIVKILLENRGLKTKKEINEFLNPQDPYSINPDSFGIKKDQIVKAFKRIKQAITNKEQIIIYGDYDADGICATAIIWETLYHLGAKVLPFIPNREELGYGLKKEGIEEILSRRQSLITNHQSLLIITVDNGIVTHKGVNYANSKGIDVIITDHHQKKIKNKDKYDLPKAHSIIWSDQISGSGVAWFLAKEIYQSFHKNLLGFKASNSLELACIGTITDMMPMLGVNRSLVKFGLQELRKSKRAGIKALCQTAGVPQTEIDTYHVGYIIGPRLNAMGRLEDALESLRLLCTNNSSRADGLAAKLHLTNRQRQDLTQTTFSHARDGIAQFTARQPLIFISHQSYNQGVIGLVAGKLVEEFYCPAVVISQGEQYSKGSVRSIKGFDIIKALRQFNDCFEDLGGHPMAAGFTIETKKIPQFQKKLTDFAKKEIKDELLQRVVKADLEIDLDDINQDLYKEIEKFAPFGLENPKPVFVSRKVKVLNFRAVGRDSQHLKLKLQSNSEKKTPPMVGDLPAEASAQAGAILGGGGEKTAKGTPRRWPQDSSEVEELAPIFEAIAFSLGHLAKKLTPCQLIDICYVIEKNFWNGKEKLELKIKDIKD